MTRLTTDRDLTEQGVDAVAAAVWDSAKPVQAGVRPSWAEAIHLPALAAGVAIVRQDARTALDIATRFVEDNVLMEYRRETDGPVQGWRPVKPWESVDLLLEQGHAVQQRPVGAWMYLDDGSNGKGNLDARLAIR